MIALAAAVGGFHGPEQGVHFRHRKPAVGAHRAMAGQGRQQFIQPLFHPPALPVRIQISQYITHQNLALALTNHGRQGPYQQGSGTDAAKLDSQFGQ